MAARSCSGSREIAKLAPGSDLCNRLMTSTMPRSGMCWKGLARPFWARNCGFSANSGPTPETLSGTGSHLCKGLKAREGAQVQACAGGFTGPHWPRTAGYRREPNPVSGNASCPSAPPFRLHLVPDALVLPAHVCAEVRPRSLDGGPGRRSEGGEPWIGTPGDVGLLHGPFRGRNAGSKGSEHPSLEDSELSMSRLYWSDPVSNSRVQLLV